MSDKQALHSENVRRDPRIAIEIHEMVYGSLDAVYIAARATELEGAVAVEAGIKVIESRPQAAKWKIDGASDVTNDGPWRIYKAERLHTWVRDEITKENKAVVTRTPADF